MKRYGKYGNFTLPVPQCEQEKFVLSDQLEKGLIDKKKFDFEMNKIKRDQLLFICKTNGGYTPPTRRDNLTLSEKKTAYTDQLLRDKQQSKMSKLGEQVIEEAVEF